LPSAARRRQHCDPGSLPGHVHRYPGNRSEPVRRRSGAPGKGRLHRRESSLVERLHSCEDQHRDHAGEAARGRRVRA